MYTCVYVGACVHAYMYVCMYQAPATTATSIRRHFAHMAARKPRPKTTRFEAHAFAKEMEPIANQRVVGFEWDGTSYDALERSRTTRSTSSLASHLPVLEPLVRLAPTGFPSHSCVREAMMLLHARFKIFGDIGNTFKVANDAASNWRTMTRHIYDMAKDGVKEPVLQHLIDMIELPLEEQTTDLENHAGGGGGSGADSGGGEEMCAQRVKSMFPDFGDVDDAWSVPDEEEPSSNEDDCQITHVVCKCAECSGKSSQHDHIEIPSAKRGGQRAETVGPKKKPAKKETRQPTGSIVLPVTIVERKKRTEKKHRECYILQATKKKRFVACQNERQSSKYNSNMKTLAKLIATEKVKTIEAARLWAREHSE